MKSQTVGKSISAVEVTNISKHGFWLLANQKEYFLDFEQYPWFKEAKIIEILDVRLLHKSHLYWPHLDVDLELSSLEYPEKYPLVYR